MTQRADDSSSPLPNGGTLYHLHLSVADRVYLVLVATFATLLVLTNIIGPKLFRPPFFELDFWGDPINLTAGIITYPLTFLVTDIVSEIYGKKRADLMVKLGFAMTLLMLGVVQLSIALEPAVYWSVPDKIEDPAGMQLAWESCFGIGGWLVLGSMCAYLVAQLTDNFLFHFWRGLTQGRHLWLRNNGSTIVSQLLDTFIVNSFLFYAAFEWELMRGLKVMLVIYLFKLALAWMDTPLCYLGVWAVRRYLRRRGAYDSL
jgi:queuosine precursor transporter